MAVQDNRSKIYVRMPDTAKAGEMVPVEIKMEHPMDVGWRDGGSVEGIPSHGRIKAVHCMFNGREVFQADLGDGISSDPYIAFFLQLKESGVFEVNWSGDDGAFFSTKHKFNVLEK